MRIKAAPRDWASKDSVRSDTVEFYMNLETEDFKPGWCRKCGRETEGFRCQECVDIKRGKMKWTGKEWVYKERRSG